MEMQISRVSKIIFKTKNKVPVSNLISHNNPGNVVLALGQVYTVDAASDPWPIYY